MNWWTELTLGDMLRGLSRYRPVYLTVAAVFALAIVLPNAADPRRAANQFTTGAFSGAAGGGNTVTVGQAGATGAAGSFASGGTAGATGGGTAVSTVATGGATGATAGSASTTGTREPPPPPAAASSGGADPLQQPDCDPNTKRIKVPSKFAPPCVAFAGQNPGSTHRGVTKDEIVVAIRFSGESNPAVSATLTAAGASDTTEDVRQTRQDWNDYFEAHYQTYGRKVKLVYFEESGDDDGADRADAIKVANEIKAFAVWGGSGTYRDELIARGVLCICGGRDAKYFTDRAPFLWGTQPGYEQWLYPGAEYIGKRLHNREAKWAGDALYRTQKRKFGIVYLDSSDEVVTGHGVNMMEAEMAKYGAKFTDRISYIGDINTAQEQARVIVARLKDKGITTVVFWGDPLAPIFLTQESTNQNYRPEWFIVGGNLVDTSFFGRTYDQTQWSRAFGVSQLWARGPQATNEVYYAHVWHHDRPPRAKATYEIIFQTNWMFYTGIHLAGPNLNPGTFRDGLFSFPPSGGGPTLVLRSFGNHGLWPFEDYTAFDDVTEVWWDPNAVGENEIGQNGKGLWRYVDGAKRLRYGQWPTTEPKVFVMEGSVTKFDTLPPEDKYPEYEHKHYHGE